MYSMHSFLYNFILMGWLISLILKFGFCLFGQIFTSAKINFKSKINEYEKHQIL